jgi:hypothetical protein
MKRLSIVSLLLLLTISRDADAARLQSNTLKAWDLYAQLTEKRIASEIERQSGFLKSDDARIQSQIKGGQVFMEKMKTLDSNGKEIKVDNGMIHHWFGSIFVPGIALDTVLKWVQDYDQHQKYFKEVEQSKLVKREGDSFEIFLRLVRTKIVTVHYNTSHNVVYRRFGGDRAYSRSATTRIAEIEDAGRPSEKEKPIGDDSGYFWRLNSYWRFRQQNGGVFIECESISLSRSIPFGFGWLVKGYVESVPRESLESTLTSIRQGVISAAKGN